MMKRMHIHISGDNLSESIPFYSGMFASELWGREIESGN